MASLAGLMFLVDVIWKSAVEIGPDQRNIILVLYLRCPKHPITHEDYCYCYAFR